MVVTTTDASSLRDAQRTVMELDSLPRGRVHLVVNRCRKKLLKSLHQTIDDAIDMAGLPLLGVIPEDETMPLYSGRGFPCSCPPMTAPPGLTATLPGGSPASARR